MRQRQNSGLNRRHFVAAAAAATLSAPAIVRAQAPVLKVGVMLPRTGLTKSAEVAPALSRMDKAVHELITLVGDRRF